MAGRKGANEGGRSGRGLVACWERSRGESEVGKNGALGPLQVLRRAGLIVGEEREGLRGLSQSTSRRR